MSTHLVDDAVKNSVSQDRRPASGGRNAAAAVDAALWNFAERLLAEEVPAEKPPVETVSHAAVAAVEPPAPALTVVVESEPEVIPLAPRRNFFVERRETDSTAELTDSSGEIGGRSSRGLPSIGRLRARRNEGAPLPLPKKLPPPVETPRAPKAAQPEIAPPKEEAPAPVAAAAAPPADVPQAAASSVRALIARLTESRRAQAVPPAPLVAPAPEPLPSSPPIPTVEAAPLFQVATEAPAAPELAVFEPLESEPLTELVAEADATMIVMESPAGEAPTVEAPLVEAPVVETPIVRPHATFSILRKLRDQAAPETVAEIPSEDANILPMTAESPPATLAFEEPKSAPAETPRPLVVGSATPFPPLRRERNAATPRWVEEEDRSRPPSLGLTLLGWFGMLMGVVGVAIAVLAVPGWI